MGNHKSKIVPISEPVTPKDHKPIRQIESIEPKVKVKVIKPQIQIIKPNES